MGGRYDLHGRRHGLTEHGFPVRQFTQDAGHNVRLLLEWLGVQGPADLSVVSVLGAVNPVTRALTSVPLAMRDRPLEAELTAALGWPVRVENDANLCAWHAWQALKLTADEPLVFLNYSYGIGLGMVLSGRVYHGATGAAGEVSSAADPATRGRRDALSVRLLRHLHAALPGGSTAEVAALAAGGDPAARRAMRAFTTDLSNHLTAVAAVLDPAVMVLQDVPHAAGPLRREVERALAALDLLPRVQVSPLGPAGGVDSAGGYGAAWLERARLTGGAETLPR
nr:ROK family protein [Deinococcus aestuarii]